MDKHQTWQSTQGPHTTEVCYDGLSHTESLHRKRDTYRTITRRIVCCGPVLNQQQHQYTKLYVAYNNAFRMLSRLPRDCSPSGMFAVNNVMRCVALSWSASQNCIVQTICGSDIQYGGNLQLQHTGRNCCMSTMLATV